MLVRYHRLVQQEGKRKTKKIDTPSSPTPKEELPTPVANSLARDTSSSLMRAATTTATTASVAAAASSATTAPSGLATRVSKQPEAVVGGAGDAASLAAHSAHVTSRRPLRVVSSNDDIARKDVAVTQVKPTTTISSGQVAADTSIRSGPMRVAAGGPMRVAAAPARVPKKRSQSPVQSREDMAEAGGEDANCAQQ
jgi:hypothetical protein